MEEDDDEIENEQLQTLQLTQQASFSSPIPASPAPPTSTSMSSAITSIFRTPKKEMSVRKLDRRGSLIMRDMEENDDEVAADVPITGTIEVNFVLLLTYHIWHQYFIAKKFFFLRLDYLSKNCSLFRFYE